MGWYGRGMSSRSAISGQSSDGLTNARVLGEIWCYADLADIMRARAEELELSRETIDARAGKREVSRVSPIISAVPKIAALALTRALYKSSKVIPALLKDVHRGATPTWVRVTACRQDLADRLCARHPPALLCASRSASAGRIGRQYF